MQENSPYSGGTFNLDLQFPSEYPFKAPRIRFVTRVYHPNIKSQSGEICADIISEVRNTVEKSWKEKRREEERLTSLDCIVLQNWTPTLNVLHCLTAIKQMLEQPDMDNPLEPEIAKQMHENKVEFDKTATEWTKQYAC